MAGEKYHEDGTKCKSIYDFLKLYFVKNILGKAGRRSWFKLGAPMRCKKCCATTSPREDQQFENVQVRVTVNFLLD